MKGWRAASGPRPVESGHQGSGPGYHPRWQGGLLRAQCAACLNLRCSDRSHGLGQLSDSRISIFIHILFGLLRWLCRVRENWSMTTTTAVVTGRPSSVVPSRCIQSTRCPSEKACSEGRSFRAWPLKRTSQLVPGTSWWAFKSAPLTRSHWKL